MPHDDPTLLDLGRAIVAHDVAEAERLITLSPDLAVAHMANGEPEPFFDEIVHYLYAGDTALHMAAAAYEPVVMAALVGQGADVHARNRRGAQPLHYAADGHPDSPSWGPSAQAATITGLLQAGADPNAVDKSGVSPLHRAVRTRCASAVAALLAGGADAELANASGSTPMDLARSMTGRGGSGAVEAKEQQAAIEALIAAHLTAL